MSDSAFSDLTTQALAKSLDAMGLRHRVIAENIANVETPGYTRSDVTFEEQLKAIMESGDTESASAKLRKLSAEVNADWLSPARANGNNVSIDKEMADMVKNSLQYEALVQLVNLKGGMLRSAITEGRR